MTRRPTYCDHDDHLCGRRAAEPRLFRSLINLPHMRLRRLPVLLLCIAGCASTPQGLRSLAGGRLPLPTYPAIFLASGVEGEAVVTLRWRQDGIVDSAKSHRVRETHPRFSDAVMRAASQWRAPSRRGDSLRVEAVFSLRPGLCARRDSTTPPVERATLRDHRGVLHILIEAEDCHPIRPPISFRAVAPAPRTAPVRV